MSGLERGSGNLDRGLDNVWPPGGPGKKLERAYELWEQNGRPADRDLEFWLQAESEIKAAERQV
jgi:hypothetical protein